MAVFNNLIKPIHAYTFDPGGIGIDPGATPGLKAEEVISKIIGVLTVFAVLWFAIQIIFAGYSFLTTDGDEKKMQMSRDRLTQGILGLFIVVIAVGFAGLIASLLGIKDPFALNSFINSLKF